MYKIDSAPKTEHRECLQNCDAPNEADRFPRSADESCKASEGFPTPVTSPLRPPKPPRTEIRQYSWRNFAKREVCTGMYIRILEPSKTSEEEEEVKSRHLESTNYDVINDAALNHDVIVAGNVTSLGQTSTNPLPESTMYRGNNRSCLRKEALKVR